MKNNLRLLLLALAVSSSISAVAASQSFDFKDPKGVNNAVFKLDAPLEAITGSASGISGTVKFDPTDPGATRGRIVIDAKSMHVPNPVMKEHMHGDQWLNVAKHGEIAFEATSLKNVRTTDDTTTADVTGKLTIKGISRDITAPVRLTYLKDKLAARTNGQLKGDLLVIRSTFNINRADFDINPKAPADKVAETIELTLSIAGAAPTGSK
jgi:polyisoprenoid-binding protein YceI